LLLQRRHDQGRPVGHARQPGRLQLGRCVREQRRGDEGARRVRRVDQAAAELFHHHHRLDGAEAHAAVVRVDGQAGQAEIGQLAVDRARLAAGPGDGVPALEAKALLDPACHRVAQRVLVVGEVEVHALVSRQLPSTVWATMLRCTSLLPP
jgi:hypothetical protein